MKSGQWLLLAMFACHREATDGSSRPVEPQAEVASTQLVKAPSLADDLAIATRWLEALRDGNPRDLSAYTRYPFELHDASGNCKPPTASSAEQLPAVLACFLNDAVLVDVLRTHDSAAIEPLPDVHRSAWAQKWQVTVISNMRIVTGYFSRNDARAHFDLWVVDGGVRSVWKSGLNGTREIQMATEWLGALKDRDIERLARVTSYPFEVRDTRREALCGKRVAKGRDTLAATVECLFRSDLLHRALVDSPSTSLLAHEPTESPPEWVEPWWREDEHGGLLRVFALVSTNEGYAFDFQMLVAQDGVRTAWKLGSFESRE